jgi:hypothetical protein
VAELLYTLIGDLVGSRALADRAGAQRLLGRALDEVNVVLGPAQPLEPTVGDEFQGAFATRADAVLAALLVRLTVWPTVDVRCGIGHGEVSVHDAERRPLLQDGPGWWAAREALESLDRNPRRRTWVSGPGGGEVNAFLLTRDQVVERLNERGIRILRHALLGHSQKDIARAEGVTPSAVSQQFARGIEAVVDAHQLLEGDFPRDSTGGTAAGRRDRGSDPATL